MALRGLEPRVRVRSSLKGEHDDRLILDSGNRLEELAAYEPGKLRDGGDEVLVFGSEGILDRGCIEQSGFDVVVEGAESK